MSFLIPPYYRVSLNPQPLPPGPPPYRINIPLYLPPSIFQLVQGGRLPALGTK